MPTDAINNIAKAHDSAKDQIEVAVVKKQNWGSFTGGLLSCNRGVAGNGYHDPHCVVSFCSYLFEKCVYVGRASLPLRELQFNKICSAREGQRPVYLSAVVHVRPSILDLRKIEQVVEPALEVISGLLFTKPLA